ncbi:aspartate aminotransferase family protein [Candidatus Thorarchaeota archaeon]|nr:MAG: aspartate aminotransferase family protein [Candidatus Thorarchaeota archaeon]
MVDPNEIVEKDKKYLAAVYQRKPVVLEKGKDTELWDLEGKRYLDCISGISVVNAGHTPERIVNAGVEQMKKLIHCSGLYYTVPQTLLAEKLSEISPQQLRKSFFCNSGAEAVEGAVKLAKKYIVSKGRTGFNVIALEGSFHGRLGLSLTLTGQSKYKRGFGSFAVYPGIVHAPAPYCYRCKLEYPDCNLECARKIEDIVKYHTTGDVAAMIVEPVMGEGGIIVPPDGYHEKVLEICRAHDILYIADEVQSGFGRCGTMFAHTQWDIEADIMSMAKALGAGMPIGGVIYRNEIVECLQPGDHFSTFGGNPVCCAMALENINYLEEGGLIENARRIGAKFMKALHDLQDDSDLIGDVRGKGLMIGIELVKDRKTLAPAVEATKSVAKTLMKNGVLIGTGGVEKNVLRIQPPLCITEAQMEEVVGSLEDALKGLR